MVPSEANALAALQWMPCCVRRPMGAAPCVVAVFVDAEASVLTRTRGGCLPWGPIGLRVLGKAAAVAACRPCPTLPASRGGLGLMLLVPTLEPGGFAVCGGGLAAAGLAAWTTCSAAAAEGGGLLPVGRGPVPVDALTWLHGGLSLRKGGGCALLVPARAGGGAALASAGTCLGPAVGEGGWKELTERADGEGGEGAGCLSWEADAAGVLKMILQPPSSTCSSPTVLTRTVYGPNDVPGRL
jgi:hypothetical protein